MSIWWIEMFMCWSGNQNLCRIENLHSERGTLANFHGYNVTAFNLHSRVLQLLIDFIGKESIFEAKLESIRFDGEIIVKLIWQPHSSCNIPHHQIHISNVQCTHAFCMLEYKYIGNSQCDLEIVFLSIFTCTIQSNF